MSDDLPDITKLAGIVFDDRGNAWVVFCEQEEADLMRDYECAECGCEISIVRFRCVSCGEPLCDECSESVALCDWCAQDGKCDE